MRKTLILIPIIFSLLLETGCNDNNQKKPAQIPAVDPNKHCEIIKDFLPEIEAENIEAFTKKIVLLASDFKITDLKLVGQCLDEKFNIICNPSGCKNERK
jgi:hypothetical protein